VLLPQAAVGQGLLQESHERLVGNPVAARVRSEPVRVCHPEAGELEVDLELGFFGMELTPVEIKP